MQSPKEVATKCLAGVLALGALAWLQQPARAESEMAIQPKSSPVARHGRLQVKGNRILGKDGRPASLAGMSLFWSQWIPQYYTAETVAWLKKDWNATVIRAAIAAVPGGYVEHPEAEMAKARTVIDAAVKEGVYVIVDWHDHRAEQHADQAATFFAEIAKRYGKKANLIYEIYNEPLKVSWPNVIKPYAEKVIAAIRKHDPDNLIVVGNPSWSQDVDVAAADPIKDPNVAYALHFYAGTHKQWLRDKAKKAMDLGAALFVTEWGTVNANGDGAIDRQSMDEWIAFMKENHLSHCNWSVADKKEGASILNPGTPPAGWTDAQLTDSGRYVRDLIRGWKP